MNLYLIRHCAVNEHCNVVLENSGYLLSKSYGTHTHCVEKAQFF